MLQVVQGVRDGRTTVWEVPVPRARPGTLTVATECSLISAGTERYLVELTKKGLLAKARERPDHVSRILQKVKQEGVRSVVDQVRAKLDEPFPLGYSAAGVVLECGAGVEAFKPGDRVAVAAPHAGVVLVGRNLCARVPDGVSLGAAAYASVAAIALQGVRLSRASLGERVLVVGLGLVGQIAVCLLKAQGCRVFGTDVDSWKLELARSMGIDAVATGAPRQSVMDFTGGLGVDAVVITATTPSNEPIEFAADVGRSKGRIVLVGVVGLDIPRPPFFRKELEFTVSFSLGPGRGDPDYEEKGIDYPIGHARWTAQRNMEAVLDLMDQGKLPVDRLTTHRFPVERAPAAYELITKDEERYLGVVLEYPATTAAKTVALRASPPIDGELGISLIGVGNFARLVLLPALATADVSRRGLCSAKGLSAAHTGLQKGFAFATTDAEEILRDPRTHAVFILTRHDLHAELVVSALRAGKHVFVEKPLCITPEELAAIAACVAELGSRCPILMVGFNRRFARGTRLLRSFFEGAAPLSISYRFAPGPLPPDHWAQDEDVGGGRIVGEACHAIDTCVALAGSPPRRVFAESVAMVGGVQNTDDRVFITLLHENGSLSSVSYQSGGDRTGPIERIEMFGGGRTATLEGWDTLETWQASRRRRQSAGKDKGHGAELQGFLRVCREGGAWPIPWSDLFGVSWASLMAVRSLREGRAIRVDEFSDGGVAEDP
jgi:predicted dehydrogenase/threonine dehydrogenase-like Zn-dependent dehydrogenase